MQGSSFRGNVPLPFIVSVRSDCREWACIRFYAGAVSAQALSDYAADELLDLPLVPSATLASFPGMKRQVVPLRVLAVAVTVSKAGSSGSGGKGQGSLALRMAAGRQRQLMRFARVQLQVGLTRTACIMPCHVTDQVGLENTQTCMERRNRCGPTLNALLCPHVRLRPVIPQTASGASGTTTTAQRGMRSVACRRRRPM